MAKLCDITVTIICRTLRAEPRLDDVPIIITRCGRFPWDEEFEEPIRRAYLKEHGEALLYDLGWQI